MNDKNHFVSQWQQHVIKTQGIIDAFLEDELKALQAMEAQQVDNLAAARTWVLSEADTKGWDPKVRFPNPKTRPRRSKMELCDIAFLSYVTPKKYLLMGIHT
jgi:hypothetical protein